MEEILREGFAALNVTAPEESYGNLRRYWELLEEKNKVMNLTAITGEEECARQHFLDCGALLSVEELAGKKCIDVGSGAGFPGLVLKLLAPSMELTMLDSLGKRVDFQKEVCAALELNCECIHGRAEEMEELRGQFDVATSRAVAKLNMLAELCLPFVKKGGVFLAMKGPEPEEEIAEAKKAIRTLGAEVERVVKYPVPGTDAVHSVVVLRKTGDTPAKYPRRWAKIKATPL